MINKKSQMLAEVVSHFVCDVVLSVTSFNDYYNRWLYDDTYEIVLICNCLNVSALTNIIDTVLVVHTDKNSFELHAQTQLAATRSTRNYINKLLSQCVVFKWL